MVAPGGALLADRYAISPQNVMPLKYVLRPITKQLDSTRLLRMIDRMVAACAPWELCALRHLQGDGLRRLLRLLLIRLVPNSVYPLNLHVAGVLDRETALAWSILDTFDMYGPQYDAPQTGQGWRRDLDRLAGSSVELCRRCGQGNTARVRRVRE